MVRLGELLRELRQKRGLSQERVATKAQIAVRTLRYWEVNQQQPRDVELESLLAALQATPQERGQIYAHLPDTRIMRLVQDFEAANGLPTSTVGPFPGIGDLLQAMRLRHGYTQEQVAQMMGITRLTVVRWESTRTLPSDEDIERLCLLLCASPEERAALQSRRLAPADWNNPLTLEDCYARFDTLSLLHSGASSLLPLADLYILSLKRQVRLLVGQTSEALQLLARLELQHGWWLFSQNRMAEAHAANWRSLDIARERLAPEPFWGHALNLIVSTAPPSTDRAQNNAALLASWLPRLPESLHFWLLCDLALVSGKARRMEEALRFLRSAQQLMATTPQDDAGLFWYFRVTSARIFLSVGKPVEAMNLLPPPNLLENRRLFLLMIWAEACLAAGEKEQAARYLTETQTLLATMPLPQSQTKWDRLTQQL